MPLATRRPAGSLLLPSLCPQGSSVVGIGWPSAPSPGCLSRGFDASTSGPVLVTHVGIEASPGRPPFVGLGRPLDGGAELSGRFTVSWTGESPAAVFDRLAPRTVSPASLRAAIPGPLPGRLWEPRDDGRVPVRKGRADVSNDVLRRLAGNRRGPVRGGGQGRSRRIRHGGRGGPAEVDFQTMGKPTRAGAVLRRRNIGY